MGVAEADTAGVSKDSRDHLCVSNSPIAAKNAIDNLIMWF